MVHRRAVPAPTALAAGVAVLAGMAGAALPGVGLAAEPAALPRFAIFGWVSPPTAFTTPERYAELAGAGMNVTLTAWDDPHERGENLKRMELAAAHGIRCLLADDRFDRVYALGYGTPAAGALLDSLVADYRDHPGFLGYYFRDEPRPEHWPGLALAFDALRERDPGHIAWNNLSGSGLGDSAAWAADVTGYADHVGPAVLCSDLYDFRVGYDYGRYVMNIASMRQWSSRYGIPFWSAVQLVPHLDIRPLTEGEVTWQVAMLLAYGARGVGYFTYWTPPYDPALDWGPAIITYEGERTPWYDVVARLNRRVRRAGERLAGFTWISTQHAGSVPQGGKPFGGGDWLHAIEGRAAIGRFVDERGTPHLLVVNSDSAAARRITLDLTGATGVTRLEGDGGAVAGAAGAGAAPGTRTAGAHLRVPLDLAAGDFALLRIEGTFDASHPGHLGPALAVAPNPAAGEVRFDLDRLASEARFEVLDLSGRRVFSRVPAPGRATFVWRGERDAGGTARAGIYLARAADARGETIRRWAWLGR